jgi:hypothetical protein
MVFRCLCPCHDAGDWGVVVTDVVEAAIACGRCKNDHVAVFRPDFMPPTQWKPDATADDGEGKEEG